MQGARIVGNVRNLQRFGSGRVRYPEC